LGKCERDYLNNQGIRCFRTIDECDEKFDAITLFHTFEHLANPTQWLNKYNDYLNEEGYLIIEVPNANDILLSLYECEKFADFTYWSAHLFLYTKKSLSMIIESTGKYDIISAGQVQRYPLANHLMWLAKGLPGGQVKWEMLNSPELDGAYFDKLKELDMCDTLFFVLRKKK
jgi:2-polyprenyl-3-methyl-5-hydroxy-6-metoxy-1,4-benzoquinol methylase